MKEFIEFIAKHLVDNPEAVTVEQLEDGEKRYKFILRVDEKETGKVIGKEGRTAKSIRTLLSALAAKHGVRASMEIPDSMDRPSANKDAQ